MSIYIISSSKGVIMRVYVRAAADIEEARLLAITDWTLCTADFSGIEAI